MSGAIYGKDLSPREAEILAHVLFGYDNAEVAAKLFIDTTTVKFHITRIYKKFGLDAKLGKAQRSKFVADYCLGRYSIEQTWLIDRKLSELILREEALKRVPESELLPTGNKDFLPRGARP